MDDHVPLELQELAADYELLRELGRGGTAVVYLARDRELGRQVAVKVIRAKYVTDDEVTARLGREARVLARLEHPNIVSIYHVRRLRGNSLALVMQHVPGRTLKHAVREAGALSFERAASVLADVAQALAYAHRHGVVHRDVKPENIFLEEGTGRALLSDFGSAAARQLDASLTGTGVVVGTPAYMSPEQIDGGRLDGRSDLYSLGLVGWEMLTGMQPWGGDSLLNVLYLQKHRDLPAVDDLRPDTPAALVSALEGSLEKDPAARWPTAEAFLGELSSSARKPRRRRSVTPGVALPAMGARAAAAETVRFERPVEFGRPAPDELTPRPVAVATAREEPVADHAPLPLPALPTPDQLRRRPRRIGWRIAAALVLLLAAGTAAAWRLLGPPGMRPQDLLAVLPSSDAPAHSTVPVVPGSDTTMSALAAPLPPDSATALLPDSASVHAMPLTELSPPASAESAPVPSAASRPDTARAQRTPPETTRTRQTTRAPVARTPATRAPDVAAAPPSTRSAQRPPAITRTEAASAAPAPRLEPAPPPPTPSSAASGSEPVAEGGLEARVLTVALGGLHSCALGVDSRAWCWGSNDRGQLGLGRAARRAGPTPVSTSLPFEALAAGTAHTCGLARGGLAYCWGANDRGQLGDGTTSVRAAPVAVAGGRHYRQLRASIAHSCALTTAGEAWCWGANSAGQLGDGSTSDRLTPVRVGGGLRFSTLAVGWHHSCALDGDGKAWCWGRNEEGQLGDGGQSARTTPAAVTTEQRFVQLAAGAYHTCGLTQRGAVWCWGRNSAGQLGDGTVASSPTPTQVQTDARIVSLVAGSVHSCGLLAGGGALCWGRNNYGQLGDGTTADRAAPTAVASPVRFARLDASGAHSCGITRAGQSYCWGYNVDGQLGDGTRVNRSRPVLVGRAAG
ncbi:MAG TPA: protein kinase [Gemmatimonadaceae bacterium]|nr:protein kinase [Gemmatimonadaceae bacterium]